MNLLKALLLATGVLVAYLLFWPVEVDPVAWTPPPVADDRPTGELRAVQRIGADLPGPEGIAFDRQGQLYAGLHDGRLLRLSPDLSTCSVLDSTGGRPLGLALTADGSVLIADALRGLLKLDSAGTLSVLATGAEDQPFGFTDDLDVAADGSVYFSDASTKFGYGHHMEDLIEHGRHGRLLRYDPASGETTVLLRNLPFANGVALGPDEAYVLVNETWEYRVTRYWLKGEKAGQSEPFIENLPGYPDNLSFNGRDRFWVAIFAPRDALLDRLLPTPWARAIVARLPAFLRPRPAPVARVIGIDLEGRVVADLITRGAEAYAPITSVEERDGWLYLGSLAATSLGRIRLDDTAPGGAAAPPAVLTPACSS